MSIDLNYLYKVCKTDGADVSIGSRYVNNKVNVVNWDIKRLLLSYFASKYVKFITRIPVFDTTAGFVCYKRKVLETIQLDKIKFVGYRLFLGKTVSFNSYFFCAIAKQITQRALSK